VDQWTKSIPVCQTTGTFCPEHELAETEATKVVELYHMQ